MPRSKTPNLTEAELRLMQILWDSGPATVNEVARALPRRLSLAYNTVLTTLRILEQKGWVNHEKRGRAHVFAPLVDRPTAQRSAVRHLLSRFFDGSPGLLMVNLLEDETLDAEDLRRLKRMIDQEEPER
jgi:predicted transcriptional regulator